MKTIDLLARGVLVAALMLWLMTSALAEPVGFRNPIPAAPAVRGSAIAMIAAQLYDAINSGAHSHEARWSENDSQYRPFSHARAPGFIVGFAAWDMIELAAARRVHLRPADVEMYQAGQSLQGILNTNSNGRGRL